MIYAQILAGGVGSRMGNTDMPKQFLNIDGKPIIIHTIEKFILVPDFDKIIVSIHPKWQKYAENIIDKYIKDERVVVIDGGSERNDTVLGAIDFIDKNYNLLTDDVLVMHDAVRPFVTRRIIDENIRLSYKYKAVDTAFPATDTIVKVRNEKIKEIPLRQEMYQGQTPQTVHIMSFKKQYLSMEENERKELSDSAKVLLKAGFEVTIVEGDEMNFKITRPFDLKVANMLVKDNVDA